MSTNETMILDLSKLSPAELDASLAKLDAAIRTLSNPETMFGVGAELALFGVGAELASAQASVARMEKLNAPYTGGDDGPIREPGDDQPKASDVFTPDEAVAALNTHAALCAKRGMYGTATDLGLAADIIDHQQEQIEEARDVVRMLVDRLEAAGLGSCTKDVRCLLGDHAGACVFSVAERDQVRRDDREADDHDGE